MADVDPDLAAARCNSAPKIAQQLEIDAKYAVYLDRQAADVAAFRRDEGAASCPRISTTPR